MAGESELLQAFVTRGDQAAFTELVNRRVGFVYSAALRQVGGDGAAAGDVTQKVFLLLARKAPRLARHEFLGGWLYATTRLVARDEVRAVRRRRIREHEATTMNTLLDANGRTENWSELQPVLDGAMHELAARDREAILLRYFDDQPFARIAEHYGLTENAARMRVDRALDKLRDRLSRRGITSTGAALGTLLATQSVGAAPLGLAASAAAYSLSGAAVSTTGGIALELMKLFTKQKIAAVAAVALVELGIYLVSANRIRTDADSRAYEQNRTLSALKNDIESLRMKPVRPPQIQQAAATKLPDNPDADLIRRLQALSDAINQAGVGSRISWQKPTLAETIAGIADSLELSPADTEAIQQVAEQTRMEIAAAAVRNATVEFRGNILSILTKDLPENRAAYDKMLQMLAQIMGPARYGFFDSLGARQSVESVLVSNGLGYRSIGVYPPGSIQGSTGYEVAAPTVQGEQRTLPDGSIGWVFHGPIQMRPFTSRDEMKATLGPLGALVPDDF